MFLLMALLKIGIVFCIAYTFANLLEKVLPFKTSYSTDQNPAKSHQLFLDNRDKGWHDSFTVKEIEEFKFSYPTNADFKEWQKLQKLGNLQGVSNESFIIWYRLKKGYPINERVINSERQKGKTIEFET